MPNYIALAIPFFFSFIGVEVWAAVRKGRAVYRFNDAVVDLSTGVSQQVALIFTKAALLGIYIWVYDRFRLSALPESSAQSRCARRS